MSRKTDLIDHLQGLATAEKAAGHHPEKTMPDDPKKTGEDRKLISLEQDHEFRDWAKSLGCSERELREAVKVVGHSADEVRRYLSYRKR